MAFNAAVGIPTPGNIRGKMLPNTATQLRRKAARAFPKKRLPFDMRAVTQ